MAHFFEFPIINATARTLRAVCIFSLSSVISLHCGANDIAQSQQNAVKPAASTVVPSNKTAHSASALKAQRKSVKPLWTDLTPGQRQALAPLSSDWSKLNSFQKKKWLALTNKFPLMKPEEQQRVQERMREWVKLTPEQRRAVRENYARAKKLRPDQKSAKWQQYQNLPEEQKKKLAADANRKKRLVNLPRHVINKNKPQTPARTASKPLLEPSVTPQTVPPARPQVATPLSTK